MSLGNPPLSFVGKPSDTITTMLSPTESMFKDPRPAPEAWEQQFKYERKHRRTFSKDSDGITYEKILDESSDEENDDVKSTGGFNTRLPPNQRDVDRRRGVNRTGSFDPIATSDPGQRDPHVTSPPRPPIPQARTYGPPLYEGRTVEISKSYLMAKRLAESEREKEKEKEMKRTRSVGDILRMGPRLQKPSLKNLKGIVAGPPPSRSSNANDLSLGIPRVRLSSHGSTTMPKPGSISKSMTSPATPGKASNVVDNRCTSPSRPSPVKFLTTSPPARYSGIDRNRLTVSPMTFNAPILNNLPSEIEDKTPTRPRTISNVSFSSERPSETCIAGEKGAHDSKTPMRPTQPLFIHRVPAAKANAPILKASVPISEAVVPVSTKAKVPASKPRVPASKPKMSQPRTLAEIYADLQAVEEGDEASVIGILTEEPTYNKPGEKTAAQMYAASMVGGSETSVDEGNRTTNSLLTSDSSFTSTTDESSNGCSGRTRALSDVSRISKSSSTQPSSVGGVHNVNKQVDQSSRTARAFLFPKDQPQLNLNADRAFIKPFGRHRRALAPLNGHNTDLMQTLPSLYDTFEALRQEIEITATGGNQKASVAPLVSLSAALADVDTSLDGLPSPIRNSIPFMLARDSLIGFEDVIHDEADKVAGIRETMSAQRLMSFFDNMVEPAMSGIKELLQIVLRELMDIDKPLPEVPAKPEVEVEPREYTSSSLRTSKKMTKSCASLLHSLRRRRPSAATRLPGAALVVEGQPPSVDSPTSGLVIPPVSSPSSDATQTDPFGQLKYFPGAKLIYAEPEAPAMKESTFFEHLKVSKSKEILTNVLKGLANFPSISNKQDAPVNLSVKEAVYNSWIAVGKSKGPKDDEAYMFTPEVLVEHLCSQAFVLQPFFAETILNCFRFWSSPDEFFRTLMKLYHEKASTRGHIASAVQVRVINVVRSWIERYWRPDSDSEILPRLLEFIIIRVDKDCPNSMTLRLYDRYIELVEMVGSSMPVRWRGPLGQTVSPGRAASKKKAFCLPALEARDFNSVDLGAFQCEEGLTVIAEQLTMMQIDYFDDMRPFEVLRSQWNDESVEPGVPEKMKEHGKFGDMTARWVADTIYSAKDDEDRVYKHSFFILLAKRLVDMRNFSSAFDICMALVHHGLPRIQVYECPCLKRTYSQLEELFSYKCNYYECHQEIARNGLPRIPLIGIYRQSIVRLRELYKPWVSCKISVVEQVNLKLYMEVTNLVKEMENIAFPIKKNEAVYDYLMHSIEKAPTADALYGACDKIVAGMDHDGPFTPMVPRHVPPTSCSTNALTPCMMLW